MTYLGGIQIDEGAQIPIGSTLYGECTTASDEAIKIVTMNSFDTLLTGITIHVKFTNANIVTTNLKLKVGAANALDILNPGGTLTWESGAVISFTYDGAAWRMNDGKNTEIVAATTYDETSDQPISGLGVADAISNLSNNTITGFGADKTLLTLTQQDGVISATFQSIEIAQSAVTDLVSDLADKAPLDSPDFTGVPTAPTASAGTNTTQIATTQFVISEINRIAAAADALTFKGTLGTGGTVSNLPITGYKAGWTYKVITAGTYAGQPCEVGDLLIAINNASDQNTAIVPADWTIAQANLDGVVTGPTVSVDGHVAVFSGNSGKTIADTGLTLGTSVPADAVFTDTHYQSTGSVDAYTGHTATTENGATILASISGGILTLTGGIKFTTSAVSTGIAEVNNT